MAFISLLPKLAVSLGMLISWLRSLDMHSFRVPIDPSSMISVVTLPALILPESNL